MDLHWTSPSSEFLLNPRLPAAEAARLHEQHRQLPALPAHLWLTTSGSTAAAPRQVKWVALSKEALLRSAAGVNSHLLSDSKDVWMQVLPSFHVGGLGIWARSHLSGARVVDLQAKWDPILFQQTAAKEQATLASLVPTQVFDLVQAGLRAPRSLRALVIGGGALSDSLYLKARALGWKLLPSYGFTECCSQVATAELSVAESPECPPLKPLPHVQVEIWNERIRVRSPALLTGYGLQNADGRMEFTDPKQDGWYLTEDRGVLDEGRLCCLGRVDQVIKVGGESVDLLRLETILEEELLQHSPGVDAALAAVPDARLGRVIHLATTREAVGALVQAYDSRVLPIERIRQVHVMPRIPRSPLGKLLRSELIRLVSGQAVPD